MLVKLLFLDSQKSGSLAASDHTLALEPARPALGNELRVASPQISIRLPRGRGGDVISARARATKTLSKRAWRIPAGSPMPMPKP